MKVLLSKNVQHLGIVGDVVDVKPGYARNYLFPRNLAKEPTDANMRQLAEARKQAELELAEERARMEALCVRLEGVEVTIRARANEEGVLYGSVGARDIAAALYEDGYPIEAKHIALSEPLRALDTFSVGLQFADALRPTIKVWVVREKVADEEEAEQAGQAKAKDASDDMEETPAYDGLAE